MDSAITVVIPTKNREDILATTLDALFRADRNADCPLEVVVVNDGDRGLESVAALFRTQPLRVFPNQGRGAAAARNCGARAATDGLLIFLDDDMLVAPNVLVRHLHTHRRMPRALVSGVARLEDELVRQASATPFGRYKLRFDYPLDNPFFRAGPLGDGLFNASRVPSFCLGVRRDVFFGVGGFDERFPYAGCEDHEFSARAALAGLELIVDEAIQCFHNEVDRLVPEKWFERQYRGIQGGVLLAHLYPEGKTHPVYRAFGPPSLGDSPSQLLRKAAARLLSLGPGPSMLLKGVAYLENLRLPDRVLFGFYKALWIAYTAKGFREGLRSLPRETRRSDLA